ncbi:MAG: protein translocase subunit SecF, partial [Acidobacteriota bacterium]
ALDDRFNPDVGFDLNRSGAEALADLLLQRDPEGLAAEGEEAAERYYGEVAETVISVREEDGIFAGWDELEGAESLSATVLDALRRETSLGRFSLLATESVGPQIGRELRFKGVLAVVLSLIGMLLYIWFRFELRFGVGALMAVFHDVLVVLGFYALMDFEFNLTTIAAFLTLVGYSVNDTVVIFDRVRENMRRNRREPFAETLNRSINQTLSRTILTSGTTLLAVGALLVLGGDVLRGFSFVLTIGIVVGTYSSVYVASPFALLWEQLFGTEARARREAKAA